MTMIFEPSQISRSKVTQFYSYYPQSCTYTHTSEW